MAPCLEQSQKIYGLLSLATAKVSFFQFLKPACAHRAIRASVPFSRLLVGLIKSHYNFKFSFTYNHEETPMGRPWGISIHKDGTVWVVDSDNNRILIFDNKGKYLKTFEATLSDPITCAFLENGDVVVCGYASTEVCIFSPDGTEKGRFRGTPDGIHFCSPYDVDINSDGHIVLADSGNQRILTLDRDGNPVNCFGKDTIVNGPSGVKVRRDGSVVVINNSLNKIQIWDPKTHEVCEYSAFDNAINAFSVAVDYAGRIIIPDYKNERIQIYEANGQFLNVIKGGQWFARCAALAIDEEGNFWIADHEAGQIVVFG